MTPSPSPDDLSGLIERLRACANGMASLKSAKGDYGICDDAADALEALSTRNDELVRAAWSDGFQSARDCLTEDEAFCLTCDVEEDAWSDSTTRSALARSGDVGGDGVGE